MPTKEALIRTARLLQEAMAEYENEPNGSDGCNSSLLLSGAIDALLWVAGEPSPFTADESVRDFIESAYKNSAAEGN